MGKRGRGGERKGRRAGKRGRGGEMKGEGQERGEEGERWGEGGRGWRIFTTNLKCTQDAHQEWIWLNKTQYLPPTPQ